MGDFSEVVKAMLTLRNQIKVYHWQTFSFARHKATDKLLDALDDTIDKSVETAMGIYGRPTFARDSVLQISSFISETEGSQLVRSLAKYLNELPLENRALSNIRDDFLAEVHKTEYLFTLTGGRKCSY